MARSTLSRDFDIARNLADYERRITVLERRLLAMSYLTPEFTATQGARVTRSSVQSIAHGAFVTVNFNAEVFDNDVMHSNVTNPSRITANVGGIYQVGANIEMESANDYIRVILSIVVNGADRIAFTSEPGVNLNTAQRFAVGGTYPLEAGDYVELQIHQTNGVPESRNVLATTQYSPQFWAVRLGG